MELNELHVEQIGTCLVGHRGAVAGALPRVGGETVHASPSPACEHNSAGLEGNEASGVAVVAEGTAHPVTRFQEAGERVLHAHVDALRVHHLVLARADELEPSAVADMRKPFPGMRPECALHDAPILGAIEEATPAFELEDTVDDLVRVELDHAPVVEQLAAEHRVREMDFPAVLRVDVADAGSNAALGHHRMGLAEQRFRDHGDAAAGLRRGDCGAHTGTAGTDNEDVTLDGVVWLGRCCHLRRRCADR